MNPMIPKRTRRLRARAATMNAAEEYDDYGPEPNMKLSHAFLVVLLLHVIAVGGLYAFNSMKAGKAAPARTAKSTRSSTSAPSQEPASPQASSKGSSGGGGGGSGGEKPPVQEKAPLVAKVSEAPKAGKQSVTGSAKSLPAKAEGGEKGLFASAKGALQKAAGLGVSAGAASKATAQTPAAESSNAVASTESEPSAASAGKSYTVRAGDTVTRIASSLGVAIPELEKANGLASNAVLQVGQVLKVPERAATPAATGTAPVGAAAAGKIAESASQTPAESNAPAASTPATGAMTEYTVVKGDNPWKIAKKFKVSQDALMKANGITDPKKIQIGQQLKVPAPTGKASQ